MLIKCPECGKEISDKALSCPNCGVPMIKKNHCIINGIDVDCSFIFNNEYDNEIKELIMMEKTNLDLNIIEKIIFEWSSTGKIPPIFNGKISTWEEDHKKAIQQSQQNVPKCPKCNSTAITTGARGVSWFWGAIGSSKTVNRCANCGYTWKPKNW